MIRLFIFLVFALSCTSAEEDSKVKKLKTLNAKIDEVNEEIKNTELNAMKGELDSQWFLRDNYSRFTSELVQGEKEERKAEELKKQLKALELEKSSLLKEK